MNIKIMMEFTNSRSKLCEFPLHLSGYVRDRRQSSPTQTKDSQFWFSQFVKCNFFNLVAATPDAIAIPHAVSCKSSREVHLGFGYDSELHMVMMSAEHEVHSDDRQTVSQNTSVCR